MIINHNVIIVPDYDIVTLYYVHISVLYQYRKCIRIHSGTVSGTAGDAVGLCSQRMAGDAPCKHFYTRLCCATLHTHFALSLSVRLSLPIFIQRVLDQTPWYHAVVEPCKRPSMPWTVAGFVISAEPTRPSEWSWGGVPARATACTTKRAHHKDARGQFVTRRKLMLSVAM